MFLNSKTKKTKRSAWVSDLFLERDSTGWMNNLFPLLKKDKIHKLKQLIRIDEMLEILRPKLSKQSIRPSIQPEARLLVTLCHLAEGTSYRRMKFEFLIAHNTISIIVKETCQFIVELLGPIHLQTPTSENEWRTISNQFDQKWQFKGRFISTYFKNFTNFFQISKRMLRSNRW